MADKIRANHGVMKNDTILILQNIALLNFEPTLIINAVNLVDKM